MVQISSRPEALLGELALLIHAFPDTGGLLQAVVEDLTDPGGVPVEDVVDWWRLVLRAFAQNPRKDVLDRIICGEVELGADA